MTDFGLHPDTNLGSVHLTVADLERSLQFYEEVLGFRTVTREVGSAALGAGGATALLRLTELPDARRKPPHSTGLYHFAVLLPSRLDLARSLGRLAERRYPLQGASDHLVSEALYLADPDGNGIELYRDRPRDEWPRRDGQLLITTERLDLNGLLAELEGDGRPWQGLPDRTRIGHIHLHVADLRQTEDFYCRGLGFDLVSRYGPQALFVSAGGYHHHIGLNTWAGVGAPPPPPDSVGLRFFTIQLPNEAAWAQTLAHLQESGLRYEERPGGVFLRDPAENGILLAAP